MITTIMTIIIIIIAIVMRERERKRERERERERERVIKSNPHTPFFSGCWRDLRVVEGNMEGG